MSAVVSTPLPALSLYDTDFSAWLFRTADFPRQGRLTEIDAAHVAEELEDMAKHERRAFGRTQGPPLQAVRLFYAAAAHFSLRNSPTRSMPCLPSASMG